MTRDKSIAPQARLIAALAETMTDGMWAADILNRCAEIGKALNEIVSIAEGRRHGER